MVTVQPDPNLSRAILIGVHSYDFLEDLPAVRKNLKKLRELLTDPQIWGLPRRNCSVIDQPLTQRSILDAINEAAGDATDTLVVYFAGHGFADANDPAALYLALPDTSEDKLYAALDYRWIRKALEKTAAKRKVVILDCCYGGRALHGAMGVGSIDLADHATVYGTCILAAAADSGVALAPPGEEYTAFTNELVSVIGKGISGGPELLDMNTLFVCLHERLSAGDRPVPHQRNRDAGGSIAIARNLAYKPLAESQNGGLPSSRQGPSSQMRVVIAGLATFITLLAIAGVITYSKLREQTSGAGPPSQIASLRQVASAKFGLSDFTPASFAADSDNEYIYTALMEQTSVTVSSINADAGRPQWVTRRSLDLLPHEAVTLNMGLDHSIVILNVAQHTRGFLLTFERTTGTLLWSFVTGHVTGYQLGGDRVYMHMDNYGSAVAPVEETSVRDLRTGKVIWAPSESATVPVIGDLSRGMLFTPNYFGIASPSYGRAPRQLLDFDTNGNLRIIDPTSGGVVSSTRISVKYESEGPTGNSPKYNTEVLAFESQAVIMRIPREEVADDATIEAFDMRTGVKPGR